MSHFDTVHNLITAHITSVGTRRQLRALSDDEAEIRYFMELDINPTGLTRAILEAIGEKP